MQNEPEKEKKYLFMDPDLLVPEAEVPNHSTFLKELRFQAKYVYYIYGPVLLFEDPGKGESFFLR